MPLKQKRSREPANLPSHSLQKAALEALEASDMLLLSADRLVNESASRTNAFRDRHVTVRTHNALQQTRSMLEHAATVLQRARNSFLSLGTTGSQF